MLDYKFIITPDPVNPANLKECEITQVDDIPDSLDNRLK